ncbi:hypothetical protein D9M72_477590 [compost metagenome]
MEVDAVAFAAVGTVGQFHLDRVAHSGTHERTWNLLVECPVVVGRAVCELSRHLDRVQFYRDRRRLCSCNRGRQVTGRTDDIERSLGAAVLCRMIVGTCSNSGRPGRSQDCKCQYCI